jgi:isopenicillin N synthase-like dioxygenase
MVRDGDALLRVVHYPANPPEGEIWAAAHDDISLFTILPRASSEGLQVQIRDGSWIDVVVPENAVILNVGAMLQNLSNGWFRSSIHRVISKDPTQERFSIILFAHAHNEDNMAPRPNATHATGDLPLYPVATRKELLWERIVDMGRATENMIHWLGQSGVMDRLVDCNKASVKAMRILKEHGAASPKVLKALEQIDQDK